MGASMRIAVTGASGRVGRAVVASLAERGHEVVGLDLVRAENPVDGVEYIVGDLMDLPRHDERLRAVDAVAHLGALMSWSPDDAERLFAANVDATARLVRALEGGSLHRFVLASSGEVYPENHPQWQPITEEHPRCPETWYGLTKVLAEEIVAFAGRSNGWSTTTLRFAHTQDPAELLDPESFFSGPRFFASRRIDRERAAGHDAVVRALEPVSGDDSTLLVARREDGEPVRMGILATADLAAGIVLALEAETTGHQVIGLGPDESTDLGVLAAELAAAAGLDTIAVTLPVSAPNYETSNERARRLLGFRPAVDRAEFVRQAADARRARLERTSS